MLGKLVGHALAERAQFERNHITNSKQAEALRQVIAIEEQVKGIADAFRAADEKPGDLNMGRPGSVYGGVSAKTSTGEVGHYRGLCEFQHTGELRELNVNEGNLTYRTTGAESKEIHRKTLVPCHVYGKDLKSCQETTMVQEEWVIYDGPKINYKRVQYGA